MKQHKEELLAIDGSGPASMFGSLNCFADFTGYDGRGHGNEGVVAAFESGKIPGWEDGEIEALHIKHQKHVVIGQKSRLLRAFFFSEWEW